MITPTRETNTTNTNPDVIKTCLLIKSFFFCINYCSQTSSRTKIYPGDQSVITKQVITFQLITLCLWVHLPSSVQHPALWHRACTTLEFPDTGMFVSYNKHFLQITEVETFLGKVHGIKMFSTALPKPSCTGRWEHTGHSNVAMITSLFFWPLC